MISKRLNAIFICIIMVAFSYNVFADTKSDLEEQNRQAQSEIERIKQDIKDKEASKTPYLEKKKQIDQQLNNANAELSRLTNEVLAVESEIKSKEEEIKWLDGEESKSREVFKTRMRSLYEDNRLSYIDILFDSVSISDFLYRIEIINELAGYDKEIIDSIIHSREKTEEAKAVLEQKKTEVEEVKKQAEEARAKVKALEAENQAVLDAINADIASAKADQSAKEKEAARIQAEIKRILESENAGNLTYSSGMIWPCPGYKTLTSYFGRRFHPVLKVYRSHNGIDVAAPSGANIIAAASGVVITSEYSSSYGNYVVINHGSGVTTLYAHMSSRGVSKGANVVQGQSIGKVGSTGISTGPHLHFEVSVNGTRQDPQNYVR